MSSQASDLIPQPVKGIRYVHPRVRAGCYACHQGEAPWDTNGGTALDIAEEHWSRTGHPVWAEVIHRVEYVEFNAQRPIRWLAQ